MSSIGEWLQGFLAGAGKATYPTGGVAIPCKPGVNLNVHSVIIDAWPKIQRVCRKHGYEAVVTSANDGRHMDGSLHYQGKAIDLRTRHMTPRDGALTHRELIDILGTDWDVVLENDHIHIEYDPDE